MSSDKQTSLSHRLHGAGIFAYIWMIFRANVGKYASAMEHLGIISRPHNSPSWIHLQRQAVLHMAIREERLRPRSKCLDDHEKPWKITLCHGKTW